MEVKAKFHLPGLRFNYPLNMFWVSLLEEYPERFREGVEIASFFGTFPTTLWNGGRLIQHDQCDSAFVKNVIKAVNAKGIPIRYTFNNTVIVPEDLDDEFSNFCMECADNGFNEVIIASPILEEYVRSKYPNFPVNSSTCKELRTIESILEELKGDYKTVVLDYNMNNQWDIINQIPMEDRNRVEVLVNTLCEPDCKRRGDHYKHIGRNTKVILNNRKLPADKQVPIEPWYCKYGDTNCIHTIQGYPTYISPQDIWEKYIPAGINNFKIEGRTANLFSLIDTYCHFMIKPEWVGETRLLLLNNLVKSGVITVNKPRPGKWP